MIKYHNPLDLPMPPVGHRFAVEGEPVSRMTACWIPNIGWEEFRCPYDDRPVHPSITYATNKPYQMANGTYLSMEDPVGFINSSSTIIDNIVTEPFHQGIQIMNTPPPEAIAHGAPAPAPKDAADATLTARAAMYGSFEQNSKVAQGLKAVLAGAIVEREDNLPDDLTEALDMVCSKLARIVNGAPAAWHDNLLDCEGYLRLVRERLEGDPR
jgi:hypothetical protein